MSDELRITSRAWDAIAAHAAAALPEECCGLLIADGDTVVGTVPARNIAADRRRHFEVDPADHFAAIRAARLAGRRVQGAYHSHPEGLARPSPTDRAQAFEDPEFIHLIAAVTRRGGDECQARLAAYRLVTGNFIELRLVRVA